MIQAARAALIALDWGTSSLRAYRLDAQGNVVDARHLPWGIMRLPETDPGDAGASLHARFEIAFEAACGDWLRQQPGLAVIACGMVGSAQGWREAPYLDVPAGLPDIGSTLTRVDRGQGTPLHIVPGLLQGGALPNVMRGEETQIAGIVAGLPSHQTPDLLVCLPGTHSKWVRVTGQRIAHFDTFMTGEVYAALREHTILGRTMRDGQGEDAQAFAQGLAVAGTPEGRAGVLSTIFSTRTLGLAGRLPATGQADYLSGLLIGHEVTSLLAMRAPAQATLVLCGQASLCARYEQALAYYGVRDVVHAPQATERGLWLIARGAGLLAE
ncbi:2-dehydro-3-deoxygalactonokinase [plant metagenome]|uniref:2-dehydro-3-deoxygalactonokinase n=1 Tax=plant metagenome TaxID=1297885 RepID=A0A484TKP2_9ZZZZ